MSQVAGSSSSALARLDLLAEEGFPTSDRALRLLATKERAPLLDRIAALEIASKRKKEETP